MKKSTLRLLVREAIEQIFEAEIKYNVGDRVEIDSSANGGIGTVKVATHPNYAVKFDQTGTTDSFHFSDLRPFNDDEEEEKNAGINTGLDESEGSFPDQVKGNDDIIWKKQWERDGKARYDGFYKGHNIESGGATFGNVNEMNRFIKDYILSNIIYNKLKYEKPLDENTDLNTDDVVAAIQRSNMVDDAKQLIFKAYKDGKLTAKNAIKIIEKTSSKRISENANPTDSISLDVPLFIRMLEYAREDAKTDMDLHNVTENALKLSTTGKTLTMADYNKITSKK